MMLRCLECRTDNFMRHKAPKSRMFNQKDEAENLQPPTMQGLTANSVLCSLRIVGLSINVLDVWACDDWVVQT